jgi:hypothetical protein
MVEEVHVTTSVPKFWRMGGSNPGPERSESDLRDFRSTSLEVSLGISRDNFVTSRGQFQTYAGTTRPLDVTNITSGYQIATSEQISAISRRSFRTSKILISESPILPNFGTEAFLLISVTVDTETTGPYSCMGQWFRCLPFH